MNRAAAVAVLAFATTAITPRATTILPVQEIFSSSSRYRHLRRRRSLATAASGGSTTKPGAATAGFVSTFAPRPSIPFLITAEANQRASWSSLFRRGSSTHWSHPQRLTRSQDGRIGLQSRCESCNELLANRVSSTRLARQEEGVASRGVQSLLGGTSAAGFETRPTSGLTQQQQKQQQQQQQQAGGRSEMREDGAAAGSAVGFDFALRPLPFFDVDGANSMITRVQVDNLAMVDSVTVELGRGLIAITGETGAGKSLISSAFSLAAGARVRGTDLVGSKGSTARVQLDLELSNDHRKSTEEVLTRLGVPLADGGRKLSVTRIVGGKGSSAIINGCAVKVGTLRELMSPLIYTVDANAFELFSRADGRLRALDRMLSLPELALAERVRRVVAELRQAEARRLRLEQRCRFEGGPGGEEDASLLHHWVEELDEFRQEQLTFMAKMRSVVDEFVADWGEAMLGPLAEPLLRYPNVNADADSIDDGGSSSSFDGGISEAEEGLSELWPRLSRIREVIEDVEESRTKVELARQLAVDRSNPESIAHALIKIRDLLIDADNENVGLSQELLEETHEDLNSLEDCLKRAVEKLEKSVHSPLPIALGEVEEKATKWKDLARKHGVPPERLGVMQSQLRVELDELVVATEALPLARDKENSLRFLAEQLAGELSAARRRAAAKVEDLINPMMADVGLDGAKVKVIVEESKTLGPNGWDKAQFLLEANEGQTKGTVDAVASSGEKSRLLLLLETLLPPPQQQQWTDRRLHPNENKLDGDLFQGDYTNDHLAKTAAMLNLSGEERAVGNPRTGISTGGDVREVLGEGYVAAEGRRVAPCAVLYDEIDAHVGGRTAVAVGRLLANQGRDSQVVVVTHTASVAALADQHLVVDKRTSTLSPDFLHHSSSNGNDEPRRANTLTPIPGSAAASSVSIGGPESTDDGSHGDYQERGESDINDDRSSYHSDNDSSASSSPTDWRSRRRNSHGQGVGKREGGEGGGMSVRIREVRDRQRELEVARMAAGDIGGDAADELARALLRCSRRLKGGD